MDYPLIENGLSLSWQLTVAISFKARSGIMCPTPLCMLKFGLAWAWTDFVHAVAILRSYVQLLSYIQKMFSCPPQLLAQILSDLSSTIIFEPWEWEYSTNFKAVYFVVP